LPLGDRLGVGLGELVLEFLSSALIGERFARPSATLLGQSS
jgi:hypothetical protein